jgi:DNA-directed RNA polymerase omega subunit
MVRRTLHMPRAGQNKYELVIVAAREARHLNELSRITGEPLPGKVTAIALGRVLDDEVPFTYEEPSPPPTES